MLYATTYNEYFKPRRRVRRLPTAGRGGGHPQAASFIWTAIPVDGDGLLDGETRPRGSVGSICPDTKSASPYGGAEKLRNIAYPENFPGARFDYCAHFVAKRLSRPYFNRLPGTISSPLGETHFRKRSWLSGRGASLAAACAAPDGLRSHRPIGQPYSPGLPLSFSARTVPTVAVPGEVRRATYGLSQHDQLRDLPCPLQSMNFIRGKK